MKGNKGLIRSAREQRIDYKLKETLWQHNGLQFQHVNFQVALFVPPPPPPTHTHPHGLEVCGLLLSLFLHLLQPECKVRQITQFCSFPHNVSSGKNWTQPKDISMFFCSSASFLRCSCSKTTAEHLQLLPLEPVHFEFPKIASARLRLARIG